MQPHVYTTQIPPYGELKIEGFKTLAYVNGNAPKIYVRIGSEAVTLPEGQCIPCEAHWVKVQNPYPRAVELTLGRGLPVQFGARATTIGDHHVKTVTSESYKTVPAGSAGSRIGYGILMKRGSAVIRISDKLHDVNSNVVIFRGASAAFIAAKPATAFASDATFRGQTLDLDQSMFSMFGEYTPADVAAWVAAAGYTGEIIETRHDNSRQYVASSEDAVFFCRYNTTSFQALITIEHIGADIGEFD